MDHWYESARDAALCKIIEIAQMIDAISDPTVHDTAVMQEVVQHLCRAEFTLRNREES